MPTLSDVSDFMYENFDSVTEYRSGTHFHARCPICGDSKKSNSKKRFHLYFKSEFEIIWHCFNCDESGNFYNIYSLIHGISYEDAYAKFNTFNKDRISEKFSKKQAIPIKAFKEYQTFNYILNDCLSIDDTPNGHIENTYHKLLKDFIKKRKINYKIFISFNGRYNNRIIIPVFEGGNLIYFQGRRVFDDMEPKYLNPAVEKQNIILNKNNFDKNKYIIVTEGLIDAYNIGKQGTSILGKELQNSLIEKLQKYTDKKIIIAMDNDKDGKEKTTEYCKIYKNILYFLMPKRFNTVKDISELVENKYINRNSMYDFILENSHTYFKTLVKLKSGG